jgi:hypothetical protein
MRGNLEGLRQGNWKLLVKQRHSKKTAEIMLFDLDKDLGEQNNVASSHPEVVERLQKRMEALDAEITEHTRQPWLKKID